MRWDKYLGFGMGGIGIGINYFWGGLDTMLIALLTLMVFDFISGVMCGVKRENLNSKIAYTGITQRKMMILVMVAVAVVVDRLANTNGAVRSVVMFFYISLEGISITENAGKLGVPIPEKLKAILAQLKDKE